MNFMQPETLLAGDIAIQAVATSDELIPFPDQNDFAM
jgi:hypothetical protein